MNSYLLAEREPISDKLDRTARKWVIESLDLAHAQVEIGRSATSTAKCRMVDVVDMVPLHVLVMCDLADAKDKHPRYQEVTCMHSLI